MTGPARQPASGSTAPLATRPLVDLASTLKAYRVTGCNHSVELTLTGAAAADLENLLTAVAEWDRVAAAREARIAAAAQQASAALEVAKTAQARAFNAAAHARGAGDRLRLMVLAAVGLLIGQLALIFGGAP